MTTTTTTTTHLSTTGPFAGESFCGMTSPEIRARGERGMHLPLLIGDPLAAFVDDHVTCPECRRVFGEVWAEG